VTLLALDRTATVLTNQFKISFRVIESTIVNMNNLRRFPLMLGMTRSAFLIANTSVVTGATIHIRSNITMVVTAHTHFVLLVFIKRLVTALTVFFEAGMVL